MSPPFLFLSLHPLHSLVCPAGVSFKPLCQRRAPLAWLGSHRARRWGPARLPHLLASPQTAAQGRGQSRAEGAWPVAAGQHVGEDLQSVSRQQLHPTDEENLSKDMMTHKLFFSPLKTDFLDFILLYSDGINNPDANAAHNLL